MNNKGWGLAAMLGLSAILVAALIVSAIVYEQTFNGSLIDNGASDSEDYVVLENKAESAAKRYIENKDITTEDTLYISITKLINEDYLEPLKDTNNHRCTGYVSYDGERYDAYINCGMYYKTNGYTASLDK